MQKIIQDLIRKIRMIIRMKEALCKAIASRRSLFLNSLTANVVSQFSILILTTVFVFQFSFLSCSADPAPVSEPVAIRVSAGFVAGDAETRGVGSIDESSILSGASLPVSMVRIDQESATSADYLPYTLTNLNGVGQAPRSARLKGENGTVWMFFDAVEEYLTRATNNYTKLIGWYPSVTEGSDWQVDGSGAATVGFTIDGQTDILMSNLVAGNTTNRFSNSNNSLTFSHLLTRLIVRVFTTNDGVEEIWGGVKKITLIDTAPRCEVQLPGVNAATNTIATAITFSGTLTNLTVYDASGGTPLAIPKITGLKDPGDKWIPGTTHAGTVLIAPETDKIILEIECEATPTLTCIIDAAIAAAAAGVDAAETVNGFVAGNSYTLSLKFTDSGIVLSDVTLTPWEVESTPVEMEIGGE